MKPKWLLEPDVFEENTIELLRTHLIGSGIDVKIIPYIPFDDDLVDRCSKLYHPEDCVIFYGSLNFGRKLQKLPWVPGVYLNEEAFKCTSYYPAIGDLLIHYDNFTMLPYGILKDKKDQLIDQFGGERIFIRPNSGVKEFTGFVTNTHRFYDSIELAGFYDVEPDLLVLVAKAWDLQREWRFVVVDQRVISGSLYRYWGETADNYSSADYVLSHSRSMWEECKDKQAWEIAEKCVEKYNPDRAWTIDVCQTAEEEYKILEIGCFSCAGMYGNDLGKIVEAVSKSALNEWNEYFNIE